MESHVSSLKSQKITTWHHRGPVDVHTFTTHLHLAFFAAFPHYNHRKSQPDTIVGQLTFTPSRLTYTLLSSPQHKIFARNVATPARLLATLFRYHKIWYSYDG